MAVLVPVGTTVTLFSAGEFTVASGAEKILFIVNNTDNAPLEAAEGAAFEIAYKVGANDYQTFDMLTESNIKDKARVPAGSYAIRRANATATSAGINIEG